MNFLFSYSGPVSFQVKRQLLRNIKSNTEAIATNPVLQKRIRYIFDEMISNVYEYYKHQGFSSEITGIDGYLRPGDILEFVLSSTIDESDKKPLQDQLDFINSLDETRLRDFYKQRLNDVDSEEGKAGLGLLTIRMKSKNPIAYEFKKTKSAETVVLKIILNFRDE